MKTKVRIVVQGFTQTVSTSFASHPTSNGKAENLHKNKTSSLKTQTLQVSSVYETEYLGNRYYFSQYIDDIIIVSHPINPTQNNQQ